MKRRTYTFRVEPIRIHKQIANKRDALKPDGRCRRFASMRHTACGFRTYGDPWEKYTFEIYTRMSCLDGGDMYSHIVYYLALAYFVRGYV